MVESARPPRQSFRRPRYARPPQRAGPFGPNTPAQLLSASRAHLVRLRAAWPQPTAVKLPLSGGNHGPAWSQLAQQCTARKTVTIIHHPQSQFWVVAQPQNHPKTGGQTSLENSRSNPVAFCSNNKSHFELPPTFLFN